MFFVLTNTYVYFIIYLLIIILKVSSIGKIECLNMNIIPSQMNFIATLQRYIGLLTFLSQDVNDHHWN